MMHAAPIVHTTPTRRKKKAARGSIKRPGVHDMSNVGRYASRWRALCKAGFSSWRGQALVLGRAGRPTSQTEIIISVLGVFLVSVGAVGFISD